MTRQTVFTSFETLLDIGLDCPLFWDYTDRYNFGANDEIFSLIQYGSRDEEFSSVWVVEQKNGFFRFATKDEVKKLEGA